MSSYCSIDIDTSVSKNYIMIETKAVQKFFYENEIINCAH